ncbi:TolB family protein [Pseudoduganella aquatica]|uniref:Bacterial Ig-like domain-containing protein n=1 Tax=Pseudoduganella aquatica TaxID=2660641 RepID=A0A7X4HF14_9BURK|nr:hypothetical protein [Pseudoduganella aquatica]MYN09352.1 hypothetical protein [Pseudoduganella aquatica]
MQYTPSRNTIGHRRASISLLLALASSFALASPPAVTVPVTEALSGPNSGSLGFTSLSSSGRYLAYVSSVRSARGNIYILDRTTGTNIQADLTVAGQPSAGAATASPVLSADGRYVAFRSLAADMGVPNGKTGFFIYDSISNITKPIFIGYASNTAFTQLTISADGRYVAYRALLAAGSTESNIYVYDRVAGTSSPVTTTHTLGTQFIQISDDGRYVAYIGQVRGVGKTEVVVHDRTSGIDDAFEGMAQGLAMSADGNVLAFVSAQNSLPGDITGTRDVFVRDRKAGTTERASSPITVNSHSGGPGGVTISADGRFVSFLGYVAPLNVISLYRYDRATRTTKRAVPAAGFHEYTFNYPSTSRDGRYVSSDGMLLPFGTAARIQLTDFGTATGVSVAPASVTVVEGGNSATYQAVLLQQPTDNVAVNVVPDAQLSVARSQLTFTPSNWNTPQTVSVQAPANDIVQGTRTRTMTHSLASSDPEYTLLPVASVTVTITESGPPTIVVPTVWSPEPIPLRGTAAPGATVLITVSTDGAPAFISVSAVADAQGNWASSLFIPSPGPYQLEAVANGLHSIVYNMNLADEAPQ